MDNDTYKQVITTIAAGATGLSGAIDLEDYEEIALEMPLAWTTANITLQAAKESAGQYKDVYDDAGTEVSITAAGSRIIVLGTATKAAIKALRFIKLRSGTSGSAVNQTTNREIIVHLKK